MNLSNLCRSITIFGFPYKMKDSQNKKLLNINILIGSGRVSFLKICRILIGNILVLLINSFRRSHFKYRLVEFFLIVIITPILINFFDTVIPILFAETEFKFSDSSSLFAPIEILTWKSRIVTFERHNIPSFKALLFFYFIFFILLQEE